MSTTRVGRTSRPETIPQGATRGAAPQHPSLRTQAPQRGTYRVPRQQQTHGAILRMLTPRTTPTIPQELGTQGTENELSLRLSGTSPSPSLTTTIFNQSRSTPRPPTSPGRPWLFQGSGEDPTHLHTTDTTLSPLFGRTTYPSLPREGTESCLSHTDSGQTSPTPVTAPTSPINNNKELTPMFQSRNPFRTSIIVAQQTPSTSRGPTSSGTHSNRSTKTSSVQNELKHGSFNEQTSKPEPTGSTGGCASTWSTTSPPTGERRSTSVKPTNGELMARVHTNCNRELFCTHPSHRRPDLRHEQRRNINSSESDSNTSPSDSTNASIGRTIFDGFQYNWESVFPGI